MLKWLWPRRSQTSETRRAGRGASPCAPEALESRTMLANVPAGYSETRVATGLAQPVAMAFAPDGRLFVTEKTGGVRVVGADGQLRSQPFMRLTVDDQGERGALGIAFDPDFETNRHLYVYYTATTPTIHNRLSRFTASSSNPDVVEAGSERVLIDFDPLSAIFHNAGSLHFGPDEKLYVAVGDNVRGDVAQSLNNLWGKMLRLNSDGSIPADNPFYNQTSGNNRAIWALGLRNAFTFAFQDSTGRMFINEVGNDAYEEINEGLPGGNYGWPDTEGPTSDPRFDTPIYFYENSGVCNAVAGALFYEPPAGATSVLGEQYRGKYFFGDLCGGQDGGKTGGFIHVLDPVTKAVTEFATGVQRPVDFDIGPDGSFYYLSNSRPGSSGHVWRVAPSGQAAPVIAVAPEDATVSRGGPATFSVVASGAGTLAYQWQRDGVDIPGATGSTYTLPTTVLDDDGARFRVVVSNGAGSVTSAAATLNVVDSLPPAATIDAPPPGALFAGGEVIAFSGTATDPEDGVLPASAFSWRVDYVTAGVERPGVPAFSGSRSGSFTADRETPFTGTDVLYRIYLTVRDSSGLETTVSRDVMPRVGTMTVAAEPAGRGLRFTVDGEISRDSAAVPGVVGVQRVLVAAPTQTVNGVTYQFESWSDGSTESTRAVSLPEGGGAFTARYRATNDGSQFPPESADLTAAVVTGKKWPAAVVGGSKGRVTVRMTNAGQTALQGPISVSLALSPDVFLDPEDPVIVNLPIRKAVLKPGAFRQISVFYRYPEGLPTRDYHVLARAESGVGAADRDATNNVGASGATVTVAPPFVDLSATLSAPRAGAPPLRRLSATLLLRNDGNTPLNTLLGLSFVASSDGVFDATDAPVAMLSRPVKLKAGGTKLLKLRLPAPTGLAAGAYRLVARVDPAGAVAESNESNNDAASDGTFTVG